MKYAFVSDIHANFQAWEAVLEDIQQENVDSIISLGDMVGYGPRPAETMASVYEHCDHFVIGNHDAVVGGTFDRESFNPNARRMIEWTMEQLSKNAIAAFKEQPYTHKFKSTTNVDGSEDGYGVMCVHASSCMPTEFHYVLNEELARQSWASDDAKLTFIGHTHMPLVDVLINSGPDRDGSYQRRIAQKFVVKKNERYIINVGSVGMPRDLLFGLPTYCLYNDKTHTVEWRRVSFDVAAFRKDVDELVEDSAQAQRLLATLSTSGSVKKGAGARDENLFEDFEPDPIAKLAKAKQKVDRRNHNEVRAAVFQKQPDEIKEDKKPLLPFWAWLLIFLMMGATLGYLLSKKKIGRKAIFNWGAASEFFDKAQSKASDVIDSAKSKVEEAVDEARKTEAVEDAAPRRRR